MSARLNIATVDSAAYKAMMGLEGYLQTISLTPIQKELIKIRASQINKCAFCLDMHTQDALKYGETTQRIFILEGWREAKELFSEEEQVLLAMTEEITLISHNGLSEETFQKAKQYFDDAQIAQIIMAIVTINAWNRIAVSTHLPIAK
ncbi:carboxymuconolactone decarboxylase family protein [Chryseobacterium carnipullorum]|uniref:Argininosuccinate synthase n=1 Tax=Chryseobacterium carnipullorum TaxID=1124835 RepID=A0A1M7GBX0_CHRCU|nr:carboxymuconolactone decarboxylase family protein [Chryseobacterium carnipullorum]MDN5396505.1 carboxymuconolactone decarboxylase family protein [Chryseobacterium sp.]AZA46819.1 carboxymuconolactone decarboxylase family protein [Chryseobacterium carnipullorum]AZA66179.1 carboxymuconolactone decarboxylase family protein [Chryseobacterium carnipullorum]MDN5423170.1 carboxymuconolactone decarboxylase family protein [Chryseobacterium sp.]MDN5476547.1 carboxymuconolactone decarboxylase family pr